MNRTARSLFAAPAVLAALASTPLLLTACGGSGASTQPTTTASAEPSTTVAKSGETITLLTYDAFVEPDALKTFTEQTGIAVQVAKGGDSGAVVNKAILTTGNPEGDVLWGLDNTLLSRAIGEQGLFAPYATPELGVLDPAATALVPGHEVTPVDTGDVCLNYDKAWFADRKVAPPTSLDDLVLPAYKDLLVVENPATSSPGLAFMLATIAKYSDGSDGFASWWQQLRSNGVTVADSWDAAYYNEFTAGGTGGKHPIVVSYASSPPATIIYATDPKPTEPTTGNVESTCFRQVEFAGILAGTKHEAAAQKLIDFLVSEQFQAALPESNFVYPVRTGVALPDLFERFAKPVAAPLTIAPAEIAANRDRWVTTWTDTVLR
jgi:thiamine transport system substrate-binding protein